VPETPSAPRRDGTLRTTPHLFRQVQRLKHRIGCGQRDKGLADAGFTLIEVIVSFVLFATVIGGATTGIVNSLRAAHVSQQRADAANLAQQYVATARANAATAKDGTVSNPDHVGNEWFTVQQTVAFDSGYSNCATTGATFTVHVLVYQKTSNAFLARSDARVLC